MLVVLEGCDGTGKTTLAEDLAKIMDAEIIHCSQCTPNDYTFFHNIIEASKSMNIIADRFCYGQFVYQDEEKRPLAIKSKGTHSVVIGNDVYEFDNGVPAIKMLHLLETEMLAAGSKVIHVTAPVEEIKDRLETRNEILINNFTVEEVMNRFHSIFKMSILPVIKYDTGRYKYE